MKNEHFLEEKPRNNNEKTSQNHTKNPLFIDSNLHLNLKDHDSPRSKTSLRLKYEAEKEVIKKRVGSLEDIRLNLGLSKRKICQLILVDPSAWTRWVKKPKTVPPHIYRSLEWYLNLQEKHPSMGHSFWLSYTRFNEPKPKVESDSLSSKVEIEGIKADLLKELNQRLDSNMMWVKTDLEKRTKSSYLKELRILVLGVLVGLGAAFLLK